MKIYAVDLHESKSVNNAIDAHESGNIRMALVDNSSQVAYLITKTPDDGLGNLVKLPIIRKAIASKSVRVSWPNSMTPKEALRMIEKIWAGSEEAESETTEAPSVKSEILPLGRLTRRGKAQLGGNSSYNLTDEDGEEDDILGSGPGKKAMEKSKLKKAKKSGLKSSK